VNALLASDEDSAPCTACGRTCWEREVEDGRGYCPHCGARWTGTAERFETTPLSATAAELFGDDTIPF
jgi:ribosomal protein L37AE/L43A